MIEFKRKLFGRKTYSRTPINCSEEMAGAQKNVYSITGEQHEEGELTKKAI